METIVDPENVTFYMNVKQIKLESNNTDVVCCKINLPVRELTVYRRLHLQVVRDYIGYYVQKSDAHYTLMANFSLKQNQSGTKHCFSSYLWNKNDNCVLNKFNADTFI